MDYRILAAFSPDGLYLVTQAGEIFRASDGALVEVADGLDDTTLFAGFTSDSTTFYVAGKSTGAVPAVLLTKSIGPSGSTTTKTRTVIDAFDTLAVSPDGLRMVLGTEKDETLKSFSLDQTTPAWSVDAVVNVRGAAVAKTMLATIDGAGQGRLWDLNGNTVLQTFETGDNAANLRYAGFSSAGDRLAWVDSITGDLSVWDAAANRRISSFKAEQAGDGIISMAFSPDGSRVATCNSRSVARVWSADDGSKIADLSLSSLEDFPQIAFARDDDTLLVADGTLDAFDARSGLRTGHWMMSGTPSPVVSSPSGGVVAIATFDGWLGILDPQRWSLPVATRMMRASTAGIIAFTPDGDRVLTFDTDNTVGVWRTADLAGTDAFQPVNEDGIGFVGVARKSDGSELLITRDGYDVIEMWCLLPP